MRTTPTSQTKLRPGALPVEWHFSEWSLSVQTRPAAAARRGAAAKPLPPGAFFPPPARRKNLFKLMKNNPSTPRRFRAGFTLVELLVVIAIIAILAAMTMTAIIGVKKAAHKMKAKTEIADIVNAINAYDTDYSRFPVTKPEQTAAGTSDFTTGLIFGPGNGVGYSYDNNSNVVAILMDLEKYPNGNVTSNSLHVYNPKQVKYLNARLSGYDPTIPDPNPPGGVDNTGIYRDPWGNPYMISMDLSYDDQCSDLLYSRQSVSQSSGSTGFNGLLNPNLVGNANDFLFHGKVMVWSAGPDKKYSSVDKANQGDNKDNILSWQ